MTDSLVPVDRSNMVLRSRQAVERRTVSGPSDALIEKARMLAAAGPDVLPKGYANSPGACMMLLDWAERNDVSIFEAVGEVSMVYGRPVISAKMQKRLAARHGYQVVVVDSDPAAATVAVVDADGVERGRYTYTLDMANALGIAKGNVWKADPGWMLVKRATTRALELYGPGELVSLFTDDDEPVDEILPPVAEVVEGPPVAGETVAAVPATGSSPADAPTLNEVLDAAQAKGIKPNALKAAAAELGFTVAGINELMGDAEALTVLADWIDQK